MNKLNNLLSNICHKIDFATMLQATQKIHSHNVHRRHSSSASVVNFPCFPPLERRRVGAAAGSGGRGGDTRDRRTGHAEDIDK